MWFIFVGGDERRKSEECKRDHVQNVRFTGPYAENFQMNAIMVTQITLGMATIIKLKLEQ